ncbi:MAG TPA: cation/multidrug efflux pump [Gammaproteobacteria bacterium]|nr:cation/multidrug efflux pump [Gammaproteobacteria bacterium]
MNQHTLTSLADLITDIDIIFSITIMVAAVFGLLLLLIAIKRLWQRRLIAASLSGCSGLGLALVAMLTLSVALNIHTYHRLTYEEPLLTLTFSMLEPKHYSVRVEYLDSDRRAENFELYGDEWQLDARILRWEPPLQILGKDPVYRLERLGGRYRLIEEEREGQRSVHSLTHPAGLDVWSLARDYQRWLPWLDAHYGSATYLPMRDGARFAVSMSQYGLIARPDNNSAEKAVFSWN